jgi:hypothetical protein
MRVDWSTWWRECSCLHCIWASLSTRIASYSIWAPGWLPMQYLEVDSVWCDPLATFPPTHPYPWQNQMPIVWNLHAASFGSPLAGHPSLCQITLQYMSNWVILLLHCQTIFQLCMDCCIVTVEPMLMYYFQELWHKATSSQVFGVAFQMPFLEVLWSKRHPEFAHPSFKDKQINPSY